MRPPLKQPLAREQCLLADFSDVLGKKSETVFCLPEHKASFNALNPAWRVHSTYWGWGQKQTALQPTKAKITFSKCVKLVSCPESLFPASLRPWAPGLGSGVWWRWLTSCSLFLSNRDDLPDSPSSLWAGINGNAFNKAKTSTALLLGLCSIKAASPKTHLVTVVKIIIKVKMKAGWIYFHKQPRSNMKPWAGIWDPDRQSHILKHTQLECNPSPFTTMPTLYSLLTSKSSRPSFPCHI